MLSHIVDKALAPPNIKTINDNAGIKPVKVKSEIIEPKQVVLECSKCGALVIKDDVDIKVDDSTDLVNTEDECQYCEEVAGYTIVGAVAPYTVAEADDATEVIENDVYKR